MRVNKTIKDMGLRSLSASDLPLEVKVFEIDTTYYEFNRKNKQEIIFHIIEQHQKRVEDNTEVNKVISKNKLDDVEYYTYVYNEPEKDSHWKDFLPNVIQDLHNFEVKTLSFVLFAAIKDKIFSVIGGDGIQVIKKYLNDDFGIEIYEYLVKKSEDEVVSLTSRGITGKLIQNSAIYREKNKLINAIGFTDIPVNIKLKLREDLQNSIFDFIDFENGSLIEIGSSFLLRKKITFSQLHELILKFVDIRENHIAEPFSSFVKEKKKYENGRYLSELLRRLRADMADMYSTGSSKDSQKFDIDFIHPSNIRGFYECDTYKLILKGKKNPFFETRNKNELYKRGLFEMYKIVGDSSTELEFNTTLLGMRVQGYRNSQKKTEAMFWQHVTCEIQYMNRSIFKIDNSWYKVKGDFVEMINKDCIDLVVNHQLQAGFLKNTWHKDIATEEDYNALYQNETNFLVFDKIISDNIELCDLMYEDNHNIYLVHVKDKFDAKIRDLTNQVLISANRVLNDIQSSDFTFLKDIISKYNLENNTNIPLEEFINKFRASSGKNIVYVLAYRSRLNALTYQDRIKNSKSNIAKFSVIKCVNEMTSSNFKINVFDLAEIK